MTGLVGANDVVAKRLVRRRESDVRHAEQERDPDEHRESEDPGEACRGSANTDSTAEDERELEQASTVVAIRKRAPRHRQYEPRDGP